MRLHRNENYFDKRSDEEKDTNDLSIKYSAIGTAINICFKTNQKQTKISWRKS